MIYQRHTVSKMMIVGMAAIIMMSTTAPLARDVLFLGVTDTKGQSAQPELERAIRSAFAASQRFRLIGELETQRIIRERDRLGHGKLENDIPSSFGLPDSTILIRGIVEEFSMKIKRHMLFWGKIDARMSVKFYIGGLDNADAYHGELSANAMRVKDLILFRSAPKVVHISAIDRTEMIKEMQASIVKEVSELAEAYFNSLAENEKKKREAEEADTLSDESNEPQESVDVRNDTAQTQIDPEDVDFSEAMTE